jgi:DNA-directed RNA polymerase specialized sigma24 family protein
VAEVEIVEFDAFISDAQARLARAFVSAYGRERAEEALAEALAYAWSHFDELTAMANPVGYLFRVGQSRTRPRRRAAVYPAPATVGVPDVEPRLVDALAQLTERQRVCVVLVHVYEWTHQEVADLLGVSTSSVQVHVTRARDALRAAIGELHD